MAEFSTQDVAFTGFRLVREHLTALPVWIALAVVFTVTTQVIMVGLAGPALLQMTQMITAMAANPGKADLAAFSNLVPGFLPAYGAVLPLSFAFNAVLYAAMNRAVLRPSDSAIGYLRFGRDELRQFGLHLMLAILFFGLYFLAAFIITFLVVLGGGVGPLLALAGILAALCGFFFLAVRLSLASAATFQTGRIDLTASWSLTKGRFWPIFGTYVLAGALALVIIILAGVVIGVVSALLAMAAGGAAPAPAAAFTLAGLLRPVQLIPLVLNAAIGALMWPIILTPPAAIYQHLSGRSGQGAADVFS